MPADHLQLYRFGRFRDRPGRNAGWAGSGLAGGDEPDSAGSVEGSVALDLSGDGSGDVRAHVGPSLLGQGGETERLHVLSLGSRQGNRHVHWHLVPLPPGVPYEQQQVTALAPERGYLDIADEVQAELARRLRRRLDLAADR